MISEGRVPRAPNSQKPESKVKMGTRVTRPSDNTLLIAHFAAGLRFAGDQIGNDVIVTLRAGNFDFANFHAVAI